MRVCEKCGRPLIEYEEKLCPACQSKKIHKIKKWGGSILTGVFVVGATALKIFTGKSDRKT
jgi:RNA polymerase subunit RPABC4/transcription elongation factor Spt4